MSNRAIKEHAYLVAYECQKICGDLPETTAFKGYAAKHEQLLFRLTRAQLSLLDTQRSTREYPTIVNNIQPCPKRCILMLLARVGARTESTHTFTATTRGVANFCARTHWYIVRCDARYVVYMHRGFCTSVLSRTKLGCYANACHVRVQHSNPMYYKKHFKMALDMKEEVFTCFLV